MKVRLRNRHGRLIHKNEFSMDDPKAVGMELKMWRDKLGVSSATFQTVIKNDFDREEFNNMRALMKAQIKESEEKTKKAFSDS